MNEHPGGWVREFWRQLQNNLAIASIFIAGLLAGYLIWGHDWAADERRAAVDHYATFTQLAGGLGGDVISEGDAAVRSALLCRTATTTEGDAIISGAAMVSPLAHHPTDLALVRAYCPEREADA